MSPTKATGLGGSDGPLLENDEDGVLPVAIGTLAEWYLDEARASGFRGLAELVDWTRLYLRLHSIMPEPSSTTSNVD